MQLENITPNLRFNDEKQQEFPCWNSNQVGELFEIRAGGDIAKTNFSKTKDRVYCFPVFANTTNLKGLQGYSDQYRVDTDCITVTGRGSLGVAHARFEKFYPIVRLLVLTPTQDMNLTFFAHVINNIHIFNESTGVPQLTAPQLRTYRVNYPHIVEQQKIADFLSAIDEKIDALTQKMMLLERFKKGLMQKLFSQELRFRDEKGQEYPDWQLVNLREVATIKTGSSNRVDSNLTGRFTFFDRSQEIRSSDRYLFDCEAVIVGGEGQDFLPKYFSGKFDLHQRSYAIMDFQGVSGRFVFYFVSTKNTYFLSQAVGSTVKSLRLPIFQKMPLLLPILPEQQKIADCLSAIDVKIELVNTQIEKTRTFKQGLLQQLFI